MDPVSQLIAEWRDFYAAVASVGATLVGLVFVGISIHLVWDLLLIGTVSGLSSTSKLRRHRQGDRVNRRWAGNQQTGCP